MMIRTDRRRFPVLIAAIAALALAMTLVFSPVQAQEGSAPDNPRGLDATATHDQVVLTWDDPGDDTTTGYVILRRIPGVDPEGQFSELVSNTGTDATTYTDDTVSAETTYTYRIKAINEHGVSERSRWFHIDTPAAPEAVEGDDQDEQGREDGGGAPGHATPPGPGGRANVSEPDGEDLPHDTTTTGEVDVGGSVTGNIGTETDGDWFKVVLDAGKTYQIDLKGLDGGGGTLEDPFLNNIRDSSGTQIEDTFNDDVDEENDIFDSQITFTPTADGTYYLVVETASDAGTYTLSVREIACTLNTGDIWCGVVTVGELKTSADVLVAHGFADTSSLSAGGLVGYPDDTMFSVGDNDYTIRGLYVGAPGGNNDGSLFFLLTADLSDDDKENLVLKIDGVTTDRALSDASRLSAGLYSWANTGLDWSSTTTVTVRLSGPPSDDFPADTNTTGQVDVGGSVTGNIESGGDVDWFLVELEAGTRYQIDLEGGGYRARHPGRPRL